MLAALMPSVAAYGKVVPNEYWTVVESSVEIACPCGATPQVERDSIEGCDGCERVYVNASNGTVVVGNSPKQGTEPSPPPEEPGADDRATG